jgi:hypothetical protein
MNVPNRASHGRRLARRVGPLAAMVAASGVIMLTGCGGSSPSTTSTGGGGSNSSAAAGGDVSAAGSPNSKSVAADAVKFARCIRSHGVSDFPDPPSSGQLTIPADDRNTPGFESAQKACKSLMPGGAGGAGPSGQKNDMSRAQALRLARCIRAHGVPNFADPNASGGLSLGSVNPNSPAVKAALHACQPAGGPPQTP